MKSFFRYLVTLLLCCLCQSAWADVTLMGNMIIGDDSPAALSPTVLFSSSNSVYSPVNPIHFSLSDAGTLTGITLNSPSAFTYGVTVIIWDSAGSVKLNATATDTTPAKISALSVALPAGDYRMAVMGACVQASSNNTKAKASTDLCVSGSPNKQWEDISFTNITLVGVSSSAVNFIQRQHIGDNTNDSKLYPPNASGISINYSFSVTQTSIISSVLLYGLGGFDVSNDSNISLSRNGVTLWGEYFTKDGNYNSYPNITLTPGDYTLTISTNNSYWIFGYFNDADDIDWDDIVINVKPVSPNNLCSAVFLYPVQGRADSDYINFNGDWNYIGSRIIGTNNGVIGYKYDNQLINRGYTYQYGWYGDKVTGNCDGKYCFSSGISPAALANITNPFPLTVSSQQFSVGWNENKTITTANGTSFKNIDVGSPATLSIMASGLRIGSLNVQWNSTVTFTAGEYWIESLTMDDSAKLLFSGKVILHVKNMTVASHSLINSPQINIAGSPENLLLILHGSLSFGSQATLSGFIYQTDDASATDKVELISPSYIYGRVSAKKIIMHDGSVINGNVSACPEYTPSTTNHYELQYLSNNLTCKPASITVNACSDSATPCTVNSAATNSVTLTAANSLWSANPVTLSAGTAKTTLSHYVAENVKLGLSSGSLVCLIDGNVDSTCQLPFVTSAFSFNIPTFYAGSDSDNVTMKALQASVTDPAVCSTLFANQTPNISFSNQYVLPTTGSKSPTLNGTTITSNTAVPVAFDSLGVGTIKLAYNDAGVLGISAQYTKTDTTAGTLSIAGSDNVAVLPSRIQLTAVGQTACSGTNDDDYSKCTVYKKAGETFTLSAQAGYGSSFVSTNNFTPESTAVKPLIEHKLLAPSAGTLPSSWTNTALTFSAGTASSLVSESDVGIYQYRVMPSDGIKPFVPYPTYQDETTKLTVPKSIDNWSAPVGRFVPAQLKATLVANGSLTTDTCVAANQVSATLGYTGQALRFTTGPMLSVTALGSDGATEMKNYQGDFAKIIKITMPGSEKFVAAMTPKSSANTLNSTASWSDGTWTTPGNAYTQVYTFSVNNQFTFGKTNTPVTPFETSLVVSTLTDSDDVKATSSLPLTFNPMAPDASAFKVYSGRLTLESVNGAENNGLALPFYMQYWNGSAYAINSADNCTSLTSNALQMNNLTSWTGIPLRVASATNGVATTTASLSPAKVSSGAGAISFTAPNASGWVDIAASSSLPDWMKDFTLPSGLMPARASFGYYHGNDRLIYRREVFGGQ